MWLSLSHIIEVTLRRRKTTQAAHVYDFRQTAEVDKCAQQHTLQKVCVRMYASSVQMFKVMASFFSSIVIQPSSNNVPGCPVQCFVCAD